MTDTLRGGIVGCGFFAANHLNAWREIDGVAIVAVCDRIATKAHYAAQRFGVENVFSEAEAMLQDVDLDFVDIITTPETHRSFVELVAQHSKHVICQKPFAPTLDDASAMRAACDAAGVQFMIHENFRWQRPMRRVKQLQAQIGETFFGRISFRSSYDVFTNQPYLAQDEHFIIYDMGVHLLDLARFFMGEVASLACHTQRVNPRIKGEDVATILLKMVSGATCIVDLSYASKLETESFPQTFVHLEGSHGSVQIGHDYHITHRRDDDTNREVAAPTVHDWSTSPSEAIQDSVVAIQRHWVDSLRNYRIPETSAADNIMTLELVFGAYQSAADGESYHPRQQVAS